MTNPTCGTCKFASKGPINPNMDLTQRTLECRRMPPHAQAFPAQNGQLITWGGFPPTLENNWCGEYDAALLVDPS